jgi:uncharacterized membrane protein
MLAAVRPDSWNLPLLFHVLGATVLVGTLAVVAVVLVASARNGSEAAAGRIGFRTLLLGSLPAYLVMRIAAEWVADEEGVPDDIDWINIGYIVADGGLLLLIVATVTAGIAARKAGASRVAGVLSLVLVMANLVALWAMTSKPL